MTKVFIAGSRQLPRLNADVKLRIDIMIEKGFTILVGDANGAVSGSFAQPLETIVIGGQSLRVGMSREEAIAKLGVCCQLTGGGDSFFVQSKGGPPFELLGAIWFSDGRVSRVKRDRAHSADSEAARFGLALFRAMSELAPSGASAAVVGTATTELSNGTDRIITIRFANGRALTVSAGNPDGFPAAVQISEELFAR